jgi:hypothetical protein
MVYGGHCRVFTACDNEGNRPKACHNYDKWRQNGGGRAATSPAQVGMTTGQNSAPNSSSRKIFSSSTVIHMPERTNCNAGEDHGTEFTGGTFTESGIWFSHCTIAFFFSHSDRATCTALFSNFCVAAHSPACIKVVVQCTSYNFVTNTLLKHSPNPPQFNLKVHPISLMVKI